MLKHQELLKEVEGGLLRPVYLLLGEDRGAKDIFLDVLKNVFFSAEEQGSRDISVYYGGEASTEEILENIRTYSIFGEGKIVAVNDFDKVKSNSRFIDYISEPNETSILVLMSSRNRISQKIMDVVKRVGRISIFWTMFQGEGEGWVRNRLRELGIQAEREAIQYIIELSGTGRAELNSQIITISNYLEQGERLTLDRAKAIVSQLHEYTVFDLCNSLFIRKAKDTLAIFRHLVHNGEDLTKIFFFCNREIQKLLDSYTMRMEGHDFSYISRKLNFKKRESVRIQSLLRVCSEGLLKRLFAELHLLDFTIKSNPREISSLSFEKFLAGLPVLEKGV
jgi:DNA polymerase-3 subunit delta